MPAPTAAPATEPVCRNCGAAVSGAYCAACGQKAEALRQPVHRFVRDAVTEFFGLDSRVWRTAGALVFRPGTLTQAYFGGRRQAYLRPLRVYLTSTLLFFFLLSVIDPVGRGRSVLQGDGASDSLRVSALIARNDSALARGSGGIRGRLDARIDSAVGDALANAAPGDTAGVRAVRDTLAQKSLAERGDADTSHSDSLQAAADRRRLRVEQAILGTLPPDSLVLADDIRGAARMIVPDSAGFTSAGDGLGLLRGDAVRGILGARTRAERSDRIAAFIRTAIGYVPTVLFLLLPLFALLLKLLYARRDWYYSEHLVFGLHTHAYAFVAFTALTGLAFAFRETTATGKLAAVWLIGGIALSIPLYFFVAQKRVYGQGWGKTILKALLLGTAYSVVLVLGIVGVLGLAAAMG